MRLILVIWVAVGLGCGPGGPNGSDSAGGTGGGTSGGEVVTGEAVTGGASSSGGVTTTAAGSTGPAGDPLAEHMPCPNGDECDLCVQTEGASICGPECLEYGPGPAPGRCPPSSVQLQSVCPWDHEVPGVCLIMCAESSDCPDPGMVCVTCPEPFKHACDYLWGFTMTGPNICAWPTT